MQRFAVLAPVLAVVLVGLVALGVPGLGTAAQDGTPTVGEPAVGGDVSVVGSWEIDTDEGDPDNPPALAVFHADGTYIELHEREPDGAGVWQTTGDGSVALIIVYHDVDENLELQGTIRVRANVELDATGDEFTAPYTVDVTAPDGTEAFSEQGTARGARIRLEADGAVSTLPVGTPGS